MKRCARPCSHTFSADRIPGMGFGVFVVWSLGLLLIDAWRNTLPNILTLPAAVLALGACLVHPQWAWGLLWGLAYLAFGRGIGGGDIKLAVPLGVVVAAMGGIGGVIAAVALSSLLTIGISLVSRRKSVAHGPSMIISTWCLVAVCAFS